jgi:hypothetical protein
MQSPDDVRQIAYLNKKHYNYYYSPIPKLSRKSPLFWKNLLGNLIGCSEQKRRERAFCADYKTIPHTDAMDTEKLENAAFGTVVLGSDIVWDYSVEIFGPDSHLFGVGLHADKILSYAASFGTVKPGQDVPAFVTEGLCNLSSISVRDENSADIVERICGTRPTVVLDPVWLWDFETDENVHNPQIENYIVVYGQDFTQEFIENLVAYAKKEGKKLVCLDCNDDQYDWCDVVIKQRDLTPYKWLGYFRQADCIATSTFHGLTFGLVFKKRIAFCKTPFIMAKISTFLKKIGLYDLFQNESDVDTMLDYDWDYSNINAFIDGEREKSMEYLRNALGRK